jgi:ubiquitin C-terminal hydrolase
LLTSNNTPDLFLFKCTRCNITYQPTATDTLCYEESEVKKTNLEESLLKTAAKDNMNPKAYHECKKCGHGIARTIRYGETMRLLYICIKCESYELKE